MLIEKKLSKLAEITGSKLVGEDSKFSKISTDTRLLKKGDLFLALKGENYDGHDFIEAAIEKGASSIISEIELDHQINYIKTKNNFNFLKLLAKKVKTNFKGTIFAITGSNGKTSTKEITYRLLSHFFEQKKIFKSPKNWNNELGLYFSLLDLEASHEIAVFELGTNSPGEIFFLSKFLNPDNGVLTNIGHAHLENLKSLEGVAEEKSDIFLNVRKDGNCFARVDDKFKEIIINKSEGKKLHFLEEINEDAYSSNFDISFQSINEALNLRISIEEKNRLKKLLSNEISVSGRMERKIGPKNTTLIDDTYNANPDSFLAAFKEISNLDFNNKICVMGKMEELGESSTKLHDMIIKEALKYFDHIFCVDIFSKISDKKIKHISKHKVKKNIKHFFNEDTLILFKASRSVKMETVFKDI